MYLGLDCSSKTIHLVGLGDDGNIAIFTKFFSESTDQEIRIQQLFQELFNWLEAFKDKIKFATIENSVYIQNIKTAFAINSIVTIAALACGIQNIGNIKVDVRSWKKSVLADGNASKDKIETFSLNRWHNEFPEQDFHDAACLALWGWSRFKK